MKRIISCLICLIMACSICACNQSNNQIRGEESSQEAPDRTSSTMNTGHAGSRSDPYSFDDEIKITAKEYSDYITEYTIKLNEFWGSNKVSAEFPNYRLGERILVRGEIAVNCDSTDDGIPFGITATYITSSLNEESADIQTYKKGELNNFLYTVYSGGTYDIMILASNDGVESSDIVFLKLTYTDIEGSNANIWVKLPEKSLDEANSQQQKPDESGETSTDAGCPDSNSDSISSSSDILQNNITPEELDALLLEQPMYVESTQYIVQSEQYKELYPDMLQAVVKNNSGVDVKNTVVAFVAWDKNNFPVKIYSYGGGDIYGAYVKLCQYDDANILNGDSYGSHGGLRIDAKSGIATFKAIVVSYDDFDGNTWENPYYETWVSLYSDKKLA